MPPTNGRATPHAPPPSTRLDEAQLERLTALVVETYYLGNVEVTVRMEAMTLATLAAVATLGMKTAPSRIGAQAVSEIRDLLAGLGLDRVAESLDDPEPYLKVHPQDVERAVAGATKIVHERDALWPL